MAKSKKLIGYVNSKDMADTLRSTRLMLRIPQKEAAAHIGVHASTLSKWETSGNAIAVRAYNALMEMYKAEPKTPSLEEAIAAAAKDTTLVQEPTEVPAPEFSMVCPGCGRDLIVSKTTGLNFCGHCGASITERLVKTLMEKLGS